jgi:hypothetical protein
MPAMAAERQYDLALFGATGFTGGLTARYLAENGPVGEFIWLQAAGIAFRALDPANHEPREQLSVR